MEEPITLLANGMRYAGWESMEAEHDLDKVGAHFAITVTRPANPAQLKDLRRFTPCQILVGADAVLTGYIVDVSPELNNGKASMSIVGQSKTCDLLECTPDISSGQFKGYTVEQITRTICALFGAPTPIGVVVQTDASQKFPDATLQRGEEAYKFLERLGRLAGVLLTDDTLGNLVLCTAGSQRAGGSLIEGQNIINIKASFSGAKMFSQYIVKGQRALGSTAGQSEAQWDAGNPAPAAVVTNLRAVAIDSTVPRYRPKVTLAEAQLDQAGMQTRANWQRNFAFGTGTKCEVTVRGWRDANGALWTINRLITVMSPFCQLDQDLLIAGVRFHVSNEHGRVTDLRLGPVEGFTPDPGQVKLHTKRGKKTASGADPWAGSGS